MDPRGRQRPRLGEIEVVPLDHVADARPCEIPGETRLRVPGGEGGLDCTEHFGVPARPEWNDRPDGHRGGGEHRERLVLRTAPGVVSEQGAWHEEGRLAPLMPVEPVRGLRPVRGNARKPTSPVELCLPEGHRGQYDCDDRQQAQHRAAQRATAATQDGTKDGFERNGRHQPDQAERQRQAHVGGELRDVPQRGERARQQGDDCSRERSTERTDKTDSDHQHSEAHAGHEEQPLGDSPHQPCQTERCHQRRADDREG